MATGVYVQLLGQAGVRQGATTIDFLPNKRFRLLAYLAYQGDWVGRDKLTFLFWPDETEQVARHNLRQVLKHIRKMDWLTGFEADGHRLRWRVETDVMLVRQALEEDKIDATLPLYRGPLLPHLEGSGEGEFGEWLVVEREQFHSRWRDALFSKVAKLESPEQYNLAVQLLCALMERDPLDEEGLQAYLRSAMKAGRRGQALSAYKAFCERLQAELEMQPTPTTVQLAKEIKDAPAPPSPPQAANVLAPPYSTAVNREEVPNNLPPSGTLFVGRDPELSELAGLFEQPDTRLITLFGPGGVGKSRLAIKAAWNQVKHNTFPDGVFFVWLDTLSSVDLIPLSIAEALSMSLRGAKPILEQIKHFIGDRRMLLVLDNYEHLIESAGLTLELLSACPHLTLLVTSRECLNVQEEYLFSVEGLAFPEDDVSFVDAQHYDALNFFLLRSKRVQRTFSLTSDNLRDVVRICRLVDGIPLGIELAATWIRLMPIKEIAQEIEKNVDFLASNLRDMPERHRSLKATFEHSWRLLTEDERHVLKRLSVFRGGFRREAASAVVGAKLSVLASVVDKSLLRVSSNGRYDSHPLLHQLIEQKLAEHPEELSKYQMRHALYYLDFISQQDDALTGGPNVKQAAYVIEEELPNLLAAWPWAIKNQELEAISLTLETLAQFAEIKAFYYQIAEFTKQALNGLDETNPKHHHSIGLVKAAEGVLKYRTGDNEQAIQDCLKAVKFLEPHRTKSKNAGLWAAWLVAGHCSWAVGRFEEAKDYLQKGLNVARADLEGSAGDAAKTKYAKMCMGMCLHTLGLIYFYYGDDYKKAKEYLLGGIAKNLEAETVFVCEGYSYLGEYYLFSKDFLKAQETLEEGLRIAKEVDFTIQVANISCVLAKVYLSKREYERAIALCYEVEQIVATSGDKWLEASLYTVRGWLALEQEKTQQAEAIFQNSVRAAFSVQSVVFAMEAILGLSMIRMNTGASDRAVMLLGFLISHPVTPNMIKAQAQSLLESLERQQGLRLVADALERGRTLRIEQVTTILAQPLSKA